MYWNNTFPIDRVITMQGGLYLLYNYELIVQWLSFTHDTYRDNKYITINVETHFLFFDNIIRALETFFNCSRYLQKLD